MLFIFMLCLCLFHFLIFIMHSAFNLFVFRNYMFTLLLLLFFLKYFLLKGYELSGEIALKNNNYYYYHYSRATLGDRSFSFSSSSVWNSIPNDVRCAPSLSSPNFRLKTYLFRSVYKD